MTPKDILIKYWGHTSFRLNQEEVIESILNNQDTLALFPTAGGKSICFQIPALIKDGVCLVISPLIALMTDQTRHLRSKNIKCEEINSKMSLHDIENIFTNCKYGNVKFLYLSPEQLDKKDILTQISNLNINIIAVDEAHCISEWGHDFRPSYRNIQQVRKYVKNAPILALTATATKQVIDDIQNNLQFSNNNIFKQSFKRNNLSYVVINDNKKEYYLFKLIQQVKNSVIVYVKSRRECEEITNKLQSININTTSYHAGITIQERIRRQKEWSNNNIRVIVATNAFGMGINKEDVRLVIHMYIPLSIESYFQQAGRAGRNGETSYAFLLTNNKDIESLPLQLELLHPSIEKIHSCYQQLINFLQIAENSNYKDPILFDMYTFSQKYNIKIVETYYILQILERNKILRFSNAKKNPSKLRILLSRNELYKFQISNKYYNNFIEYILRNHTNISNHLITIKEDLIAHTLNITIDEIKKILHRLQKLEVIHYIEAHNKEEITFIGKVSNIDELNISPSKLQEQKEKTYQKTKKMISYILNTNECRSKLLLSYFGEEASKCDICDYCIEIKRKI